MYVYILGIFCWFSLKKLFFYHFHFFSWWSIKFLQQSFNQSETGIGDKNLSVELLSIFFKKLITPNTYYLLCESPMYLRWQYFHFFFLSGFSFTDINEPQDCKGKGEGISFPPQYHFHSLHRHLDTSRGLLQKAHLCT